MKVLLYHKGGWMESYDCNGLYQPLKGYRRDKSMLLLSNFETIAPMAITFKYMPFGHILNIKKVAKNNLHKTS